MSRSQQVCHQANPRAATGVSAGCAAMFVLTCLACSASSCSAAAPQSLIASAEKHMRVRQELAATPQAGCHTYRRSRFCPVFRSYVVIDQPCRRTAYTHKSDVVFSTRGNGNRIKISVMLQALVSRCRAQGLALILRARRNSLLKPCNVAGEINRPCSHGMRSTRATSVLHL